MYNTIEWKIKSTQIKKRDGYICQICGARYNLHVHHKYYINGKRIDDYPSDLLITLCNKCHLTEHAIIDLFQLKCIDIRYYLKAGFTALDLYNKVKNKEWFNKKY